MPPVVLAQGLRFQRPPDREGQLPFALQVDALRLEAGDALGVVGPSGCGKSTLIDLLALLRRPGQADRLDIMGMDAAALWRSNATDTCNALRARHIGVVLQTGGLLPFLSVLDNVMLSQRLLGQADTDHAQRLLRALDLDGLQHRLPAQLSIGQRQRCAIARALAHRPALVLADEPTAALGAEHAAAALDLLLQLCVAQQAALLVVSHDLALLQAKGVVLRHCVARAAVVELEAA